MKIKIILFFLISLIINFSVYADEQDCTQFKKLSAKYIECNAKKFKKSSTKKVNIGKKKFQDSGLGDKLKKFKNSKTHKEFTEK